MSSPFSSPLLLASTTGGTGTVNFPVYFSKAISENSIPSTLTSGGYIERNFQSQPTPTSLTKRTISVWLKRCNTDVASYFHTVVKPYTVGATTYHEEFRIGFNATGNIVVQRYTLNAGGAPTLTTYLETNAVFRDPTGWYHIVLGVDTSQATSSDRLKFYVNGVQITSFSTASYPALNATTWQPTGINNPRHTYGLSYNAVAGTTGGVQFQGYIAEVNSVDNAQLTPTSFGRYNSSRYDMWEPIKYNGSYSGNWSYYINFELTGTGTGGVTTWGTTYSSSSGAPSLSAAFEGGLLVDRCSDVPVIFGNDSGFGGQIRGNYSVLMGYDMLNTGSGSRVEVTKSGLRAMPSSASSNGDWKSSLGTVPLHTGKWYFETKFTSTTDTNPRVANHITTGCTLYNALNEQIYESFLGAYPTSWGLQFRRSDQPLEDVYKWNDGGTGGTSPQYITGLPTYYRTISAGDVIGCAVDVDAGKIWWSKNGVWLTGNPATNAAGANGSTDPAFSNINSFAWSPGVVLGVSVYRADGNSLNNTYDVNFGQRAFIYPAPTGYKSPCTANLPDPLYKPKECFDVVTRTGTTTQRLSGITTGFNSNLHDVIVTNDGFWYAAMGDTASEIRRGNVTFNSTIQTINLPSANSSPRSMVASKDTANSYLYIACLSANTVEQYNRLSQTFAASYSIPSPIDVDISSDGVNLYVLNSSQSRLYTVNTSFSSINFTTITGATANMVKSLIVSPDDRFVDIVGDRVLFRYNTSTNTFTTLTSGGLITAGSSITIDPSGVNLYIGQNTSTNKLLRYSITSSSLSALSSVPATAPTTVRCLKTINGGDTLVYGGLSGIAFYDLTNPNNPGIELTPSTGTTQNFLSLRGNTTLGFDVYTGSNDVTVIYGQQSSLSGVMGWRFSGRQTLNFAPKVIWTKTRNVGVDGMFAYNDANTRSYTGKSNYAGIMNNEDINIISSKDTPCRFNSIEKVYYPFYNDDTTYGDISNVAGNSYVDFCFSERVVEVIPFIGNATTRQINHSLGVKPTFVITKNLIGGNNRSYYIYFRGRNFDVGTDSADTQRSYRLNKPQDDFNAGIYGIGDTVTTTYITIGSNTDINNTNDPHIILAIPNIEGIVKCDVFSGDSNVNGPFVWTGFRPKFLLLRSQSSLSDYNNYLFDSTRTPNNVANLSSQSSSTADEVVNRFVDFYANGFKIRDAAQEINRNTRVYYLAFAETPFKYALAR